jgi:DNA-binding Lrp family transcriptional regulator
VVNNDKREFTGVWIPRYIIDNKDLKPVDRLIYAEVSCFELCIMSNATLAERAGCSEATAKRSVKRLVDNGFLIIEGFNGRVRKMTSRHIVSGQNDLAASSKCTEQLAQNDPVDNKLENNKKTDIAKAIGDTPETYGNADINEMFEYWEQTIGYKIDGNKQRNRNACNNLIKKYKLTGLKQLVNAVSVANTDNYAPRISDFQELQSKLNQLLLWAKKKGTNNATAQF